MTLLQEEAVQMIQGMSDDNVGFLIEVIRRLTLQKDHAGETNLSPNEKDNVIQLTDFWIKTVYHNLPNIENTVQLGNSGINKWAFTLTAGV